MGPESQFNLSQNNNMKEENEDADGRETGHHKINNIRNTNNKSELWEAIEELGNYVYCYSNKRQAKFYTKTTKNIADYVESEYNKDMRKLVNDGVEVTFTEPKEPE